VNQENEKKLISKNTRPTSMRLLVYDFLANQKAALSLTDIEQHFHYADRITIYRTLKTFEEKGIIHSIQENTTTKYMLCADDCNETTHQDLHLHLYCKRCRQTTCQEDFSLPKPIATNFKVDEVRFFAKGICSNCLDKTLQ
jgi:Fur family transcriptional regulator, ferric uptake regulator